MPPNQITSPPGGHLQSQTGLLAPQLSTRFLRQICHKRTKGPNPGGGGGGNRLKPCPTHSRPRTQMHPRGSTGHPGSACPGILSSASPCRLRSSIPLPSFSISPILLYYTFQTRYSQLGFSYNRLLTASCSALLLYLFEIIRLI